MKKIVLLAATAATLTLGACNSCGNNQPPIIVESETEIDSLYMVNDSTVADAQTFIFEGIMPLDNGTLANVVLTIQATSLNDDGTYSMTNSYMNGNSPQTSSDNGETVVLLGMSNDSTAVIYELISANDNPRINLRLNSDSTLTKVNSKMQSASSNPLHKLVPKK